jgi:GcrA cell cycle regulator
MTPEWSKDKVAKLLKLKGEGLSASQIGAKMRITRSAVIGKLHRLEKAGKAIIPKAPVVPKDKEYKERHRQRSALYNKYIKSTGFNPTPGLSTKPEKVKETEWDKVDPKTPGLIRAMDLKNDMCRWPLNNATQGEFYFCGDKVKSGKVYCGKHYSLAYVPVQKRGR